MPDGSPDSNTSDPAAEPNDSVNLPTENELPVEGPNGDGAEPFPTTPAPSPSPEPEPNPQPVTPRPEPGPGQEPEPGESEPGEQQPGEQEPGQPSQEPSQLPCDEEISARGVTGCLSTMEGLQVKYFPLADGVQANYLAVYFHGDHAGGWKSNGIFAGMIEWAEENQTVLAGALSPALSTSDTMHEIWWRATNEDTDAMSRVITRLGEAYGTQPDEILFWGISGGSQFLTGRFLPRVGHLHPGVYVNNCGGSDPWVDAQWDYQDESIRDGIAVYYNYGDQDFLAPQSEDGFAYWSREMFTVDRVVHPNATHCAHEIRQVTIDFWERHLTP